MHLKHTIKQFIETRYFQHFITFLIIFNGITLGMATSRDIMSEYGVLILWIWSLSVYLRLKFC